MLPISVIEHEVQSAVTSPLPRRRDIANCQYCSASGSHSAITAVSDMVWRKQTYNTLDFILSAVALVFSYIAWCLLRPFFISSSLSQLPAPPVESWWTGNFYQIFNRDGWNFHRKVTREYGSAVRVHGFFGDEQLYVYDPRALYQIVTKDIDIYEETDLFLSNNQLVFGTSLLSTIGDHHRKQRKRLNPLYSMKRMRELVPVFYPIAHQLTDALSRLVKGGQNEINIMSWMSRNALEFIGRGGLGYTFDALDDTKTNEYSQAIKMLVPSGHSVLIFCRIVPYVWKLGPDSFRRFLVDVTPWPALQRIKNIVDMMYRTSVQIYTAKKATVERGEEKSQIGNGRDIMTVLLQENMKANPSERMPEEEVLGQMSSFIFAGHDSTTSAMCRILHLFPEVQERLRAEIVEARREHGDMDYDTLMALPYLDAVCRETMRAFPPVPFVRRTTQQDVVLPLQWPILSVDGKTELREIHLKKNTNIFLSILAANTSKTIWGEDAEEWKPDRWLSPLPDSVAEARLPGVYSSTMTFLGGGRACIGFKFTELEMKMVLSLLLETFSFSLAKEITWNMNALQSPVVKDSGDDVTPQMPLRLSLLRVH